jgi:hypothetical protein
MIHTRLNTRFNTQLKFWSIATAICLTSVSLVSVTQERAIAQSPSPSPPQPAPLTTTVSTWNTFTAKQGRFSILMPEQTQYQSLPVNVSKKMGKTTVWVMEGRDLATPQTLYGVSYMDFESMPPDVSAALAQEALDAGAQNFLAAGNRHLMGRSRFALQGNPGQEIRYRLKGQPGFTGRCRTFLVGNRLYVLMVETDREAELQDNIDRFMQSFKLI